MKCKKAETLLVEYLYQELSPKRTVALEKHLRECSACAKTLENWRAIHRGFQRTPEEPQPSPYLKTRLLAAAKEELERAPAFSDRLWAFSKLAAVPLMIFVIALLLYVPWQMQQTVPKKMAQGEIKAAPTPKKPSPAVAESPEPSRQRDADSKESIFSRGKQEQGKTAAAPALQDAKKNQYAYGLKKLKESGVEQESKDEADAISKLARNEIVEEKRDMPAANRETFAPAAPAPPPSAEPPAIAPSESNRAAAQYRDQEGASSEPQPQAKTLAALTIDDASFERSQDSFARNDFKSGWNQAQQAIAQDRNKALAGQFHQSGMQFQQKREYDKAIIQYQLVANYYPNYNGIEDVLLRLAESYSEIGQFENARRVYQQLLRSPAQQKLATEKLKDLQRKEDAQEQLRSLGYVEQNKQ